jgi:hypothetical protein
MGSVATRKNSLRNTGPRLGYWKGVYGLLVHLTISAFFLRGNPTRFLGQTERSTVLTPPHASGHGDAARLRRVMLNPAKVPLLNSTEPR